ncbi:FAD:protein FMN transferase [Saccharospirillum impatiens]|uniref:FAD:protein FMN transferase n=1 Tax=Saccharospirillum impatiens TaxID=169438 RepID=UPI00040DC5C7|nr:FAD:protein FMN transferase [Saccharospirillum impatiens]
MFYGLKKLGVWLCLTAWLLSGCSGWGAAEVQKLSGYSMGTSFTVSVVASESEARALDGEVRTAIDEVNVAMSTYLPRSDVSRFNDAPVNGWIAVSPMTAEVVSLALEVAEASNGAFDPTIGPLVDLWGFGPKETTDQVPSEDEIKAALAMVGWQAVEIDMTANKLRKMEPRELDLSAIAKGFAVDQVANLLEARGFEDYLVEIGGEMRFSGTKPGDDPWRVAIESPDSDNRSVYEVLEVTNGSMATSGDYRNFFEQDGQRYSHTLDPKTGYPIRHDLVSATVLGDRSVFSDAYATAFMVMGAEAALSLAAEQDMAVYLIQRGEGEYTETRSVQFEALFEQSN